MQEPTVNPQDPRLNPQPTDPTAIDPTAATAERDMTLEEMLSGIQNQLGGMPSGRQDAPPDMDPMLADVRDKQFEQDVRFALEDMQKAAKSKIPDASDTQAYKIGLAMMQGDMPAVIDAVRDALKREAEVDQRQEEQKTLHVEGGASGKPDEGRLTGLAGAFDKINRTYGTRSGI